MRTIEQSIEFRNVSVKELYETYANSRKHAAAIGAEASIQRRVGGQFRAFGPGGLTGKILHLVPGKIIVQTWRSLQRWQAQELDSVLVLTFEPTPRGARLNLTHSGVPNRDFDLFNQGWRERYWKPWKQYFSKK
jgi:activator of HSP90 ATPase